MGRRSRDGDEGSGNRGGGSAAPPGRRARAALPQGPGYALKRAVLGPALPTAHLVARAPGQADRARGVRLRQPLVGGLRDRGDPEGRGPRRRRWRRSRWSCRSRSHPRRPRRSCSSPTARRSRPTRGRRRLHRHPGQLRAAARPGRRRGAAHRLRPHGGRVGRRRHRGPHVGVRRPVRRTGSSCRCSASGSSPGATSAACASRAGCSPSPRTSSSLMMFVLLGVGLYRARSPATLHPLPHPVGREHRHRGRRRCSSCSTRSPRAAPRSPGWRPSPTACPHSSRPSGGTPGPR